MRSTSCMRRLFKLAESYPRCLWALGGTTVLTAVGILVQMVCLSQIINATFVQHTPVVDIRGPILWLAGAICLRASALGTTELIGQHIAARVKKRLRKWLLRSLIRAGPAFTQGERTGELTAYVVEGVERLDAWYTRFLPHAMAMAIVPVTLVLFVLWIDWPSGVVLMLTGPVIPIFMALIGMMAQLETQRQWSALTRMSGHFLDVLQGLPTLHLFGRSSVQSARISQVSEDFRRTTMRVLRVAFLSGFVLELAASISIALVAVEIGLRLIAGMLDFQTGLMVLLLAPEYYLPFRQFGASHHAGIEATAAGERIFRLLDSEPTIETALKRGHGEERAESERFAGSIEVRMESVEYQYPEATAPALQGVTLQLNPGRFHLLVGESGAGKSTMMKLLLRFMEPGRGTLFVNDQPMQEIPPAAWRRNVAFVSQHPHFFEGTVLDNLRAARPAATLAEVKAAVRLAEAEEFINALPQGYGTPIREAAARFSGGERQRLAIARAFLKDASLVLADEPANHLDIATAAKLERAFLRLAQGRTTLVVAHHGFSPDRADILFVLAQGHLIKRIEKSPSIGPTDFRSGFESIEQEVVTT
jgi:ATP-binding cassette, subfamily C, bacterial CydD